MAINILLIEEDSAHATLVADALVLQDFCVVQTFNSWAAFRMTRGIQFDLILIDIQLADLGGNALSLQLCKYWSGKRIPIIALSFGYSPASKYVVAALALDGLISLPVDSGQFAQQLFGIMAKVAARTKLG